MEHSSAYRLKQAKELYSQGNYVASSEICDVLTRAGEISPALLHLKALHLIRIDLLDDAKQLLGQCVHSFPSFSDAWLDLGYLYAKQGHDEQALAAYHKAISIDQRCSAAYNGIAVIYARRGDSESAVIILKRSLVINPDDAVTLSNLARILDSLGYSQKAIKNYRRLITISPTAKNYLLLARIYQKRNMPESVVKTCKDGLKVHPKDFELRRLLCRLEEGVISIPPQVNQEVKEKLLDALQLVKSGELTSAEEVYQKLHLDFPDHPLLLHDYGLYCLQYFEGEKKNHGLAMLDRCLLIFPDFILPYKILTDYFFSQNDFESVVLIAQEGLRFSKTKSDFYHVLSMSFKEIGRLKDAISTMEEGLRSEHTVTATLYSDLGMLYSVDGQFTKAKNAYQKALTIDRTHHQAKFNYGLLLSRSGMLDASIEMFESLSSLDRNAYEAFLYTAACHPQKHRLLPTYLDDWASKYAEHIEACSQIDEKNSGDKIRIGYVSPDFRNHPVAYFMKGTYAQHDKSKFEIYSYYNGTDVDENTVYFKKHSDTWRDVKTLNDQDLANRIRKDQIDILVDLSGHTTNNRLPIFVSKPAPIQVTYLGYLTTTGIPQMDYRIIDHYATPDNCTEELIELPDCYLCYQPLRSDISSSAHALSKNGYVTFGSFHRLPKIHSHLINIWSKILNEVPDSVLLMKTRYLDSIDLQTGLLDQFINNGITPERIIFKGHSRSILDHLCYYDEIDIMLDSFPYNGTTVTCESLWMGVPVVTLAGDLHMSRVGVTINTNAGFSDLIGHNEEDYVRIAVELAKDQNRLSELNKTLRDVFLSSKVCDPVRFTRNLEEAYKNVYHKWLNYS
ncbi:MAG: hypothetical protein CMJ80_07355 [Planctomycetaceae bacterium]|nr:hypothetical protein [Planctomycetaceae bacterium]